MARRWPRRLFYGSMVAVTLGVVAAAALPWWWPAVLARVDGVTIGDWTTSGWSAVELREVVYEREGLRVTAARVRVPAFGRWPLPGDEPAVRAQDVVITPQAVVRPEPAPPPATRRIVGDVLRAWPGLVRWLPPARGEGVTIAAGDRPIQLSAVSWDGARIEIAGTMPGRDEAVTIAVMRPDEAMLQIAVAAPARAARIDATVRSASERLAVEAQLAWRANSAALTASFGADDLLPANATLDAPTITVPAAELGLAGYGPARGALRGSWTGGVFAATLEARAEPLGAATNLPPLAIDLRASGGDGRVRVDSATVHLPGIEAKLSAPFVLALRSGAPAGPAEFSLEVDLAAVPRSPMQGRISGRVVMTGGPDVPPAAEFSLAGEAIRWRDAQMRSLAIAGHWQPGVLRLDRADVQLGDDSTAHATAEIDLTQRRLASAALAGKLTSAALRPWAPALPEFAELVLEARADGPLARPAHSGKLRWSGLAGVPGRLVDGDATWQGAGADTLEVAGSVHSAAGVTLPFAAKAERAANGSITGEVSRLAWQDTSGEWWRLGSPAHVQVTDGKVAIDQLALTGDAAALTLAAEVRWPVAGRITLEGRSLAAARLAALVPPAATAVTVDAVALQAAWNDGSVQFDGTLRATYAPAPATAYSVETEFRTENDRLAFGALRVLDASGVVLQGTGRLPFTLTGRADGLHADLPRDGELALTLASTPNPPFWESITQLTHWQVSAPTVAAELSGTLAAPRGRIALAAAAVQPPPGFAGAMQLPRVGDVTLVLEAADDGLALTEGIFTLEGNWVSLSGRAPWDLWREARAHGTVPWRAAEFAFSADRMPMALASRAAPTLFAPDGDVSFSLRHAPGRGFDGFLILADAALRALPPLGAVRDIGGRIEVAGYAVRLPELGALVGGRPITITGEADIAQADRPVFDVRLTSARVPLVREAGLVLRAGVDLRVAQTAGRTAHLAGTIDLGQSVFVSELASFLPTGGGVSAPEQRPPYFSVRERPFADWTLDVALRGEDFLRVENPFFTGTISADFRLTGTLAEPRALGRAWSDRGALIFPFGRLRLDQLEVALTEQNPYAPALRASAGTRIYGYDVRLEASGTADEPRLLFSSDPPLTSQAIFLMLSTGELPDTTHTFTTSERARRLALFVGRNLASSLGLGGGGADGEERLIVRSGEDFSREGGETLYVQYNLDGRWSVVAEKDRFDAYNGGLKFRIVDR